MSEEEAVLCPREGKRNIYGEVASGLSIAKVSLEEVTLITKGEQHTQKTMDQVIWVLEWRLVRQKAE